MRYNGVYYIAKGFVMKKLGLLIVVVLFFEILPLYAQNSTFPSGFEGTWKRESFNNILTVSATTLRSSSQDGAWTLSRISGDSYIITSWTGYTFANGITIRLLNGNLVISGDSGDNQDNWNGTWAKYVADTSPNSEDDFDITQNEQGGITITGYRGTRVDLVIPETIEGIKVTEIKQGAFQGKGLTSITIPNSITSIGGQAFYKNQLTSITIGNGVTSIGYDAFNSNKLTSITIPNNITFIGTGAFANNLLTSVVIPDSVTTIYEGAFQNNQLTNVIIGNSVTEIGVSAFSNNKLTSVTIGNKVTTIEFGAFAYNQLTSVIIPDSVTNFRDHTQVAQYGAFAHNQITSIIIPKNVRYIGHGTFADNPLTSVTITANITTFGGGSSFDDVFENAPITTITLPANVDLRSKSYGSPTRNINNVFPNNFGTFYESQGKKAGTYTWTGRIWRVELPTFPSSFIGTWKRGNYNNTLTFSENTVKISSNSYIYDIVSISGDSFTLKRSNANPFVISIKITNGSLVITGDSGTGQDNWNGTWLKQ